MKFLYFIIILTLTYSVSARIEDDILRKTLEWDRANNSLSLNQLKPLYSVNVIGYTKRYSLNTFLEMKRYFFKSESNYTQAIISDITIKICKEHIVKCEFIKKATFQNTSKEYPSYLIFEKINGEYQIIEEGDEITNSNLNYSSTIPEVKSVKIVSINNQRAGNNWTTTIIISIIMVIFITSIIFWLLRKQKNKFHAHLLNNPIVYSATVSSEININKKPIANKEKGDLFESYIIRCFDETAFRIEHWQSDKGIDGRYAEANKDPDLILTLVAGNKKSKFAVECKYRSTVEDYNQFNICYSAQFSRYKEFAKKENTPVFIALGIGGKPDFPDDIYMLPLKYISHPVINLTKIKGYRFKAGKTFYYDDYNQTLS
jgi:hypothetical protein